MRLRRDAGPIAEKVGRTSDGVRPCAARHLESGVERALSDGAHGGRPREIDGADRAFVADLACQRPADPGHSAGSRASDLPADRAGEAAEAVGHPRLATVATGNAQHPGRRPDRAPQDGQLPRAAVPRRGAGHPGRARIPPPACDPSRAAGARSGEATGTGGSGRSLLASANRRPARRPPRGQDARGPRPRRIPGRQAPEGRPDAGRVWRRLGAHPREGETPPAVRPGPPRARVRARVRLPAGPGRDLLSGTAHRMLRGIRVSSGDEPGGSCATSGGERRAGRPRAEAEPVGHRPDDRRTRRGHPPPGWGRQDKLFAGRYARRLHHRHQPRTGERQGRSLREGAQDVEPGPHHPARGAHPPGAQDHARRSELPRAREREHGPQHLRRCGPQRQEGRRLKGAGLPRRGHGGVPHRVRPLRQRARLAVGRPPTFTSTSSRPCSPRREPSRAERSCPPGKRHGIRRFPGKPTRRRLEIMVGGIKPGPLDTISDHKRGRGRC